MSNTISSVLNAIAIIVIVGFCLWKPEFPKILLSKLGIQNVKVEGIFLGIYWISIPVVIYYMMMMMWKS